MKNKEITITKQISAVLIFLAILLSGILLPILMGQPDNALPIESIMFISAVVVSLFIVLTTHLKWEDLFKAGIESIHEALPGLLVLLVVGPLIAAFIMSGLMPMLVYYGIKFIHPRLVYAMAFTLSALFSIFTGTSWGATATIGVVMMGVGDALGANMAIVAGAIVGGVHLGDKMSPLSNTTNIAAIASKVDLYTHIASMIWTVGTASFIALIIHILCGFIFPPTYTDLANPEITRLLQDLSGMFNFNILLVIPLGIVLFGSFTKKPSIPVMASAAVVAFLFAKIFQNFTWQDILTGLNTGFSLEMVNWYTYSQPIEGQAYVLGFFQRGGFWELGNLIAISSTILFVVGVLGSIEAMPATVNKIFGNAKSRSAIILSSLLTGVTMIAMTANGIACSFVTAGIFGSKYDEEGIDRRVLSRTTEDTGGLLEALFPWTPAAIFFTQTLGVGVGDYAIWSIVNWCAPLIAVILAITGVGTYQAKRCQSLIN